MRPLENRPRQLRALGIAAQRAVRSSVRVATRHFELLESRRLLSSMTYTVTTTNDVIDPNDNKLTIDFDDGSTKRVVASFVDLV